MRKNTPKVKAPVPVDRLANRKAELSKNQALREATSKKNTSAPTPIDRTSLAYKQAEQTKKDALRRSELAKKSVIPTKRPVAPNKKLK